MSGLAGFSLCAYAVFHLALWAPSLPLLLQENEQYGQMIGFSRSYLVANLGIEPTFRPTLASATLMERLGTALYFMSWGWWSCLFGSGLLLAICPCFRSAGSPRWTAVSALLIVSCPAIPLAPGLAAQYFQAQGDWRLARGLFVEAIRSYDKAIRFSPRFAGSENLALHLGEACYHLGISTHPSLYLFKGDRLARQRDFEGAIVQYLLAAKDSPRHLRTHIQRGLAGAYASSGLDSYRKGEIGPAADQWEKALAADPHQVQSVYFLTKAYFDQGRYDRSISMGRRFLARSRNRLLNANVQANIGDGYWKLGDLDKARVAYRLSMKLDSFENYRILKSLGGT